MTAIVTANQQASLAVEERATWSLGACQTLADLQTVWEKLAGEVGQDDVTSLFPAFEAWMRHFNQDGVLPGLLLRRRGVPVAVLPVIPHNRWVMGMALRMLISPGNDHWRSACPIVGSDASQSLLNLLKQLRRRKGWDMLELGPMLRDGRVLPVMVEVAKWMGLFPMVCGNLEDPVVRINGTWEEYYAGLSGNLRSQIARGENRLGKAGNVSLQEYRGGDDLPQRLEEFYRIEASGWKGAEGTAISGDEPRKAFYSELAKHAAQRGWLRLYFLRVGDRCVAADYCLEYGRTIHMLKVGYDQEWAKYSPGQVMRKRVLRHLFDTRPNATYDMMMGGGDHRSYKARWANHIRYYSVLRLFNPGSLRGQLAGRYCRLRQWMRGQTGGDGATGRTSDPGIVE